MSGPPAFPSTFTSAVPQSSTLVPTAPAKPKTHQRSLSDASAMGLGYKETNLMSKNSHKRVGSYGLPRNCLGDLTSGHAFDNGCMCFEPVYMEVKSQIEGCVCGVRKISILFYIILSVILL